VALIEREDVAGTVPVGQDDKGCIGKSELDPWKTIEHSDRGRHIVGAKCLELVGAVCDLS